MASRYYGINKGQTKKDVVEGSSTNSTNVEISVDLAVLGAGDLNNLLKAIEDLKNYIVSKATWPPA